MIHGGHLGKTSKKHSEHARIRRLLSPPSSVALAISASVVQGGPDLEAVFALLHFTVPSGPFFHLDFVFHNIRWAETSTA